MSLYNIIKQPVVTEKSQLLEMKGVYTLIIDDRATKVDVRTAVERLYGVSVTKVNIINTRTKVRVNGKYGAQVKRKEKTKALVTLAKGARIQDFQTTVTK